MAQPQQLQYFGIDRPTLPYRSFTSPVDESPHFASGAANVWALASGYLTKRPGFSAAVESALSAVPGTIQRIFGWKRWAGSLTNPDAYFVMLGTVDGGVAKVWALNLASGVSFTLLWTETSPTAVPFDFIDANNFVYFGNASTRQDMRKWDGSGDSTLWGLDPPPAAPTFSIVSGQLPNGLTLDPTTGTLAGTPTVSGTSSITVTVTDSSGATSSSTYALDIDGPGLRWNTKPGALPPAVAGTAYSQQLSVSGGASPYVYSLYAGTLPAGLSLSSSGILSGTPTTPGPSGFAIKVTDTTMPTPVVLIRSFSIFTGSAALALSPATLPDATVSSGYSTALNPSGGTGPYTFAFAGGTVPPGLTFTTTTSTSGTPPVTTTSYALAGTPSTPGQYSFIVKLTDSSATPISREFAYTLNVGATALTLTTTALPPPQQGQPYSTVIAASGGSSPYSFSYTAGSLTAQTGYVGGYTYVSRYGHESAMSDLSDSTGLFTDQNLGWDFIASTDPQVTGINYYRSPDGGEQRPDAMRLVISLPNATESYLDSTQDQFLGNSTGPAEFVNALPQPLRGFVYSTGRIWGFNATAAWYTGDEEVTNGIAAECMSNAQNGNFYRWPSETFALAVTDEGVNSLLSEEVWQVTGDTLDTFRKARILKGGGTLSPTCTIVVGSTVYWFDTAHQLWSSEKGELGAAIRPDIASAQHDRVFLAYHKSGLRNWLCLLDATTSDAVIYVYDFDLAQWQTPWQVPNATALATVQTSATTIDLLCAFSTGHVRKLTDGSYDDDGSNYADQIRLGLLPIVPGRSTTARNTESVRQVEQWEMETSITGLNDAGMPAADIPDQFYSLVDDDPTLSLDHWSLLTAPQPLQNSRTDATAMMATRWPEQDPYSGRRVAFAAVWEAGTDPWKVFSFDLAIRPKL